MTPALPIYRLGRLLAVLILAAVPAMAAACATKATSGPPLATVATTTVPTTTTTLSIPPVTTCVENPAAQQWVHQADADYAAGAALDERLIRNDIPNSPQYNADYQQIQNQEGAISNDLRQLHEVDNCLEYTTFTPTP